VDFSDGSVTMKLSDEQPKGLYFARVFAKDADGTEISYGQTTDMIKVRRYDSLKTGIPAAATVCSIIGVSTLIVYFAVDKLYFGKQA